MDLLLQANLSCFLLSYLVALIAEVTQFFRVRTRTLPSVAFVAVLAGLVAHTAYLVARFQASGLPPLVGSSHDWLLVLAWLGVVVALVLPFSTKSSLGIFVLPAILVLILLAVSVDASPSNLDHSGADRWWGILHASSLVMGIGLVTAACVSALMYLLQYRRLQGKLKWVGRLRLPSLERLTGINYWLVLSCFPLLTIGLFSGFILTSGPPGSGSGPWSDPIVWVTIMVWLMMTANLTLLVQQKDQTGRMVARRTLLAGAFLLVMIFGLTFVTGGIHGNSDTNEPATTPLKESR